MIAPSEEDSQTFTVSAVSGEAYKLKAADAKERQFWVNKLRKVALSHDDQIARRNPPIRPSAQAVSSLNAVRDILFQTQKSQRNLVTAIETFTATDPQLLLLKATSQSTIMSLVRTHPTPHVISCHLRL